jgi:TatD DNase family protein
VLPGLADSHCHLQHERFDPDRDAVLARAVEVGIERILVPGWDLASSEAALGLAERHAPLIQAAVGIHPHYVAQASEGDWSFLEGLMADPSCSAVGEIGLDLYRNLSPPDVQRAAIRRQLEVAARLDRPVIVHDREAHAEVTNLLIAWNGRPNAVRGVLHAFSGDARMASALTERGFLVSFALTVAFRTAVGPRAAAAAVPDGTYLVETDAPYLGPDRDARNEPTTSIRVAAELARIRSTSAGVIAAHARSAYDRLIAP